MTENKSIETIEKLFSDSTNEEYPYTEEFAQALYIILEEIQAYWAIGTVEELKTMKENGAFTGVELAQIAAMQRRLRDYQTIGTVEECRAAVERMKPKEVKRFKKQDEMLYQCGVCGRDVFSNNDKYCAICGQVLDWSEEVKRC